MTDKVTVVEFWKYAIGPIIALVGFIPLVRYRMNSQKEAIAELREEIKTVREDRVISNEMIVATASLTSVVAQLAESNVQVKNTLFELQRLYSRIEKYEEKNSAEHKDIRDKYMSRATFEMLTKKDGA